MTEGEIETRDEIVDFVYENGPNGISAYEVDFVYFIECLTGDYKLSDKQKDLMGQIKEKLGI